MKSTEASCGNRESLRQYARDWRGTAGGKWGPAVGQEMPASRLGLFYSLGASLAVSVASALVKSSSLPAGQVSFLAGLALSLVGLLTCPCDKLFPAGRRLPLALFALLSGCVLLSGNQAVRLMPLADEVVVSYTSVAFTLLLARVFLKERLGHAKLLSTVLVLAGVGLVSERGTASTGYPRYGLGCFLALFGALFDAATYIFIKGLSDLHVSSILLSCGWASMILTGPMQLLETWTLPSEPLALASIVVLTLLQEVLLYLAVNEGEEAGIVSLVQAADIVFSYIWEMLFFSESQNAVRFLGAGLVSFGVCLAALASDSSDEQPTGKEYFELPECDVEEVLLPVFCREEAKQVGIVNEVVRWVICRKKDLSSNF